MTGSTHICSKQNNKVCVLNRDLPRPATISIGSQGSFGICKYLMNEVKGAVFEGKKN